MKRCMIGFAVLLMLGVVVSNATAAIYTDTIPLFDGARHEPWDTYPLPVVNVGTFTLPIPVGESIVSATISGQWGNAIAGTTARNELYVDGLLVADTDDYSPDPYSTPYTPWTYTFTDFSVLQDGVASFDAVQTSEYNIRLDETTLTVETQTGVIPEPGSIVVWSLLGALGTTVVWWRRRKPAA